MAAESKRVLIVGGTGFVGEGVRSGLSAKGYVVRLLVRSSASARHYQKLGFETEFGDIQDAQSLFVAMRDVDAVINLVAIIKETGDATFESTNFQGTANLVDAACQASVDRLIQMSAIGVGNLPDIPYYYTKWRAETYVQDQIPHWTIIRPSIVFGPSTEGKFQFVGQLADLVRSGPLIPVPGSGEARFQPIHLDDVGGAFAATLADDRTIGQVYEIGGPDVLTYREMVDLVADSIGISKPVVNVPVPLIRLGVRLIGPLPFVEPPVTADQLRMLKFDNVTTHNAAPELLNRPLKSFRDGLDFLRDDA